MIQSLNKVLLALSLLSLQACVGNCPPHKVSQLEVISQKKPSQQVEHIVFLWLKEGSSAADLQTILNESKALNSIPGITSLRVGTALKSERPIVDDSFHVGIVMTFQSPTDMKNYLIHPEHQRRVKETFKPLAAKILVYDIVLD